MNKENNKEYIRTRTKKLNLTNEEDLEFLEPNPIDLNFLPNKLLFKDFIEWNGKIITYGIFDEEWERFLDEYDEWKHEKTRTSKELNS
mgnify:CR=1 FL=1